jgi:hypothetical protein
MKVYQAKEFFKKMQRTRAEGRNTTEVRLSFLATLPAGPWFAGQ